MSRKFFFVICLFFYVLQPCAQDFEEALLKSSEILKENSYEIELEHLCISISMKAQNVESYLKSNDLCGL